ncbi:MAG: PilZ domain-containing protein [Desulfobulbus sp.]|nr:PilZ domain-containing protein [Desulfobulbus sp.]
MSVDSRRSPRLTDYLPLEVHVVQTPDYKRIAGPFAGRIIDISIHGACLLMSQVMQKSFHVFHSTRENGKRELELCLSLPPVLEHCRLHARPVWLDLFQQGEIRAFKMGVAFSEDPDKKKMQELQEALAINQKHRADWWQTHCRRSQRS